MRSKPCIVLDMPGVASYVSELVRGAQAYAQERGDIKLLLSLDADTPGELEQLQRLVKGGQVVGILAKIWNRRQLEMTRYGVPVVDVSGTWPPEEVTSVHADDAALGQRVAEYLLGKGLRNFAFAGASRFMHARNRQLAFVQAIHEAGYPCSVRDWPHATRGEMLPDHTSLQAWLRSLPKPVGLMAWFDYVARDIIQACEIEGLRVPDDVVVIGAGNDELMCEVCSPSISSVDLSRRQVGYRAMQVLMEMVEGRRAGGDYILVPPGQIIERESSKGMVLTNPEVAAAIRYIEEHLDQPLEVRDVLRHVSLSRRVLEGHFLRLFGRTPREHIRHLQLERAKTLLRQTNTSIKDVALRSGFPRASAFCATFRREFKMTPGDYRNRAVNHDEPVGV